MIRKPNDHLKESDFTVIVGHNWNHRHLSWTFLFIFLLTSNPDEASVDSCLPLIVHWLGFSGKIYGGKPAVLTTNDRDFQLVDFPGKKHESTMIVVFTLATNFADSGTPVPCTPALLGCSQLCPTDPYGLAGATNSWCSFCFGRSAATTLVNEQSWPLTVVNQWLLLIGLVNNSKESWLTIPISVVHSVLVVCALPL